MGWAAVLAWVSLGMGPAPAPTSWPLAWSPAGDWVAVTLPARGSEGVACRGWLLRDDPPSKVRAARAVGPTNLWAARADDGSAVLLDRCPGPLTAPAWKPDGTALAFGRLVPGDSGRVRFEVVIQEGVGRRRVLASEELDGPAAEAESVAGLTLAWSPDGTMLALPSLRPGALDVRRVADGSRLARFERGKFPAWSPDGSTLAFYQVGEEKTLEVAERGVGRARRLIHQPQLLQPPVWSADNRTLWLVAGNGEPLRQVDLLSLDVDGPRAARQVFGLVPPSHPKPRPVLGAWAATDRRSRDWIVVHALDGEPSQARRLRLGPNLIRWTSGALDPSPAGAVAVAPDGRRFAVRLGTEGLPALFTPDATDDVPVPIAPDDATRRSWLVAALEATRSQLRETFPEPTPDARPTIMPVPGEEPLRLSDPNLVRLRRLVKIGRALGEAPETTADPGSRALRDEARLVFAALDDDYPAALADLGAVEARAQGADERERLLGLRAQLLLGRGQSARARDILGYLRRSRREPLGRFEVTAVGPRIVREADRGGSWVSRLADRAEALGRTGGPAPRLNIGVPRLHLGQPPDDDTPPAEFVVPNLRMLRD